MWAYDVDDGRVEEAGGLGDLIARLSGDLFVARADESLGDQGPGTDRGVGIDVVTGDGVAAPFLRVTGDAAAEVTGPAFSPDGRHLYFSSRLGTTYEVTGPFRS